MNWLDIVIALAALLAAWEGWKQGLVTQILGLAALALGIFLAWKYGQTIVSFIVILVAVILVVVITGRATRGVFRIVGLGVFDNILGVAFAALKMALFVGLVIMAIEFCDPRGRVITETVKEESAMWRAVDGICDVVFPFVRDMFREWQGAKTI